MICSSLARCALRLSTLTHAASQPRDLSQAREVPAAVYQPRWQQLQLQEVGRREELLLRAREKLQQVWLE